MSDTPIEKMDFKQLRNEVQLLRDELAMFKRMYEDMIYNLDNDNFSGRIIKEKDNMKAELKVNAEEISTKVSNGEFESYVSQTAEEISSKVSTGDFTSAMSQTAESISTIVSEFIDTTTAEPANSPNDFKDRGVIYKLGDDFYYYNVISKQWEIVKDSGMVNSLFEQTRDGFKLKGNVQVDGSCVLTNSLTFNSEDRPIEVQYSVNGKDNWHNTFNSSSDRFMQLKIGADWSSAMRIIGTDATVTPDKVFEVLTNNGDEQGLFTAFVKGDDGKGNTKLYINAEYLATKIAKVADLVYVGETGSNSEKKIQFSSGAYIKTYLDGTGNPPTGLSISASTLDISTCSNVSWGKHKPTAVFG